jgi:hypothetical protein
MGARRASSGSASEAPMPRAGGEQGAAPPLGAVPEAGGGGGGGDVAADAAADADADLAARLALLKA